jgi:hypothetical protein
MGCGDAQGDSQGDAGASTLGAAKSTSAPPSPRSPLPESRAVRGSRFWALADESSDEEDLPEVGSGAAEVLRSPRSGLSTVTLGDFLSPAWLQVRPGKPRAAARRRERFAPGGRASWLRRAPGVPCSRSRSRSPQGGVVASGGVAVVPSTGGAAVPASCPAPGAPLVQPPVGRAVAPAPEPVVVVEEVSVGASVGPPVRSKCPLGLLCPLTVPPCSSVCSGPAFWTGPRGPIP